MKSILSTKWWIAATALLLLIALSAGVINAQADGTIVVTACLDQNADGDCDDAVDGPAPAELEACLNDDSTCLPAPATFTDLAPGSYTPFLQFVGASQGYYPTTPSKPVELADGEQFEVTLGAVYPVHPKGVAVHEGLNKVYVAFQGPSILPVVTAVATNSVVLKPYPFVAVIDGETDQVLYTIGGGEDGIGRQPWGVAVSGDNVYVGSYEEGRISVIDANDDTVVANIETGQSDAQPTAPTVNPVTGWVHFADYRGGRMIILNGTEIVAQPRIDIAPTSFSPFEVVVATDGQQGHSFVTMRDALQPQHFKLASLVGIDGELSHPDFRFSAAGKSGSPHALGLWQTGDAQPRLFFTYADDTRLSEDNTRPNPHKLAIYSFPVENPKDILQRNAEVEVGNWAEVGLVYDPLDEQMLGTYGGFFYNDDLSNEAACSSDLRGGTYFVNRDGGVSTGPLPDAVVGNPALTGSNLQWKNPFEVAVNATNGKIYVTDRCWNDYAEGGLAGGGAVLVSSASSGGTPTPTPTTGPTTTPTVTPTPQSINLIFSGPAAVAQGESFSVTVRALDVGGNGVYGMQLEVGYDPALISVGNLQVNADFPFVVLQNVDNV
ncbi:MAG TPA: hypothetical protein VGD99_02185, partial [Anaerolineae bacterium]